MHILCDITHPAHVHFFKNAIGLWTDRGHRVTITTRGKDITLDLLNALGLDYLDLGPARQGLAGLAVELPVRDLRLTGVIRRTRPDVVCAIGGIFAAHAGLLARIPSVVFYDTENARLQNALTYPAATWVVTPDCYEAWAPKKNHVTYPGYHELAYCHPNRFTPDPSALSVFGLSPGEPFIVMRLVSWGATHDVFDSGITEAVEAVKALSGFGRVLITSERPLSADLEPYRITTSPELCHQLLYHARLFIGESATMASESAMFGTPAVFISTSVRGYTNEQGARYGLVFTFSDPADCQRKGLDKAVEILSASDDAPWQEKRHRMLADKIDVTAFVADFVEQTARQGRKRGRRPSPFTTFGS